MKYITIVFLFAHFCLFAQSNLPIFNWEERPEWVNIKTEITPAAVGDGTTDDTQALQTALNLLNQNAQVPKVIYLPAGTYRITQTLTIPKSVGALIIGQGANTRLLYDGVEGGELIHTYGFSRGQMLGVVLDGNNKNGWLVSHNATTTQSIFEASTRYRYVQFKNAGKGVQGGQGGGSVYAASEMEFDNCLFFNCATGIEYQYYNYYNEFVHHCEFWQCGYGINAPLGNTYIEQCHFRNSLLADIRLGVGHGHSIRRCSSLGSNRFVDYQTSAKSTIQDCVVSQYTNTNNAISHYASPCFLVFDVDIQNPPNNNPPIYTNGSGYPFILSNVNAPNATSLYPSVPAGNGVPLNVPMGSESRQVTQANQSFFIPNPNVPTKVFDAVRDFGAIANDNTDDTQAIQNTINAAKNWGNGAIAYFPTGQYRVSSTILIDGSNYFVGGSGYGTQFRWVGVATSLAVFNVDNARNVIIENINIPSHLIPSSATAILHTANATSHVVYDNVFTAAGTPTLSGNTKKGFHFKDLPASASVFLRRTDGGLFFENCGDARIYGNFVQTPPLILSGSSAGTAGFLGLLCVNGGNGINLQTSGNQNLVIANMYSEQSGGWGTWGTDYNFFNLQGSGNITVGGQKMHMVDHRNMFRLTDFSGRFGMVNGIFNLQNPNPHYQITAQNSTGQVLFLGNNTATNPLLVSTNNNLIINQLHNYDRTLTASNLAGAGAVFVPSPVAAHGTIANHALQFDGVNDYAVGTLDNNHYKIDSFSVAAWVRPDAANESGLLVGVQPTERDSSGNDFWMSWRLELVNGKVRLRLKNGASSFYTSGFSTTTLQTNQWYHITATWDRQTAKIFINGNLEATGVANFTNALVLSFSSRWTMGGSAGSFFKGALDEVQFFRHRILSDSDILAKYNNGTGVYGAASEANLYHAWHFDTPNQLFSPDYTSRDATAVLYEQAVNHNASNALTLATDVLDDFRRLGSYAVSFNLPLSFFSPVLPVEIIDFKGQAEKEGNHLTWLLGEIEDVKNIEIEKSNNGKNFTALSILSKNSVDFMDKNPFALSYYRLKINELDGKFVYSKIISIEKAPLGGLGAVKIYPSVTSGFLTIENAESFEIVNAVGQVLMREKQVIPSILFNIHHLKNGIYFVKGVDTEGFVFSKKIVKQ
ncbi:MAG: LamG-like jellyroll fold domain-containing protein [Saprospiraceae bacterium]|nr:LamG-like jellyroll fold domain-containing protein [Saprospiraceae bacterium]